MCIRDRADTPAVSVPQTPPATAAPKPTATTAKPAVTYIKPSVSKSSLSIYKGNSSSITVKNKVRGAKGTFSSSKKSVAAVNSSGRVTGKDVYKRQLLCCSLKNTRGTAK